MRKLALGIFMICGIQSIAQDNIYSFKFETLDGQTKSFSDYKGKKILIVNTASECGFTPQYEGLQELHEKVGEELVIIGFPANNFGKQEPGSNDEIAGFCQKNYGVTFQMAAKISVKGDDMAPLFKWLCSQENVDFVGDIRWNFEKILISEEGIVLHRFRSGTKPMSKELTSKL